MQRDPWATILSAAGAAGAAVGLFYAVGVGVLSFRYEGFGFSGQDAVAVTPREQVLIRGGNALLVWTGLGLALGLAVAGLRRSGRLSAWWERVDRRTPDWAPAAVLAAVLLVLLLVLRVWWPLLACCAVATFLVASRRLAGRPIARLIVYGVAIGAVAVSYEADRLRFVTQNACVEFTDGRRAECGVLVSNADRGMHVGVVSRQPGAASELVFLPAERILRASIERATVRVNATAEEARREPLRSRIWKIDIR